MRTLGWPGSVGALTAGGAAQPSAFGFDLQNAPDDEFFEIFLQANPLIGMRAVNSLEYAPHALPNVHSVPSQAFEHTRTFNTASWIFNGTVNSQMVRVNERDWKYVEGTGSSDLAQRITGGRSDRPRDPNALWTISWRVPKGGSNNVRYVRLSQWEVEHFCSAIYDLEEGDFGTIQNPLGTTVPLFVDRGDEWEIVLTTTNTSTLAPYASIHTCISSVDPNRVSGGEIILAEPKSYPGPWREVPYVETDESAALTNWQFAGTDLSATVAWDEEEGFCYELTGNVAGNHWMQPSGRRASVAVPHTMTMRAKLVTGSVYGFGFAVSGPSELFSNTSWEDISVTLVPNTVPAELPQIGLPGVAGKVRFRMVDAAEGQETFGLDLTGYEQYLIRRKQGIGALYEPDGTQNKCQVKNVAKTDLTGLAFDNATNEQVVQRGQIVGNLTQAHWDSVEAEDPKGTFQTFLYFERGGGAGTGNVIVTGPTGNLNNHNASIWVLGAGSGQVGLSFVAKDSFTLDGTLQRRSFASTPSTTGDRLQVTVDGAGAWGLMAGEQLTEGDKLRSLIATGGANRTKSQDRPTTAVENVGIDTRRNSAPNSSSNGAVLGVLGSGGSLPTGWEHSATGGWTMEVVGFGSGYVDVKVSASAPTQVAYIDLLGRDVAAGVQGESFFDAAELSVIAGSLAGVDSVTIDVNERDAIGTYLGGSSVQLVNVLSDAERRYAVSRVLQNANAAFAQSRIAIDSTSALDVTIRIRDWSLQKSTELLPHIETTTKPIPFAQGDIGFTVIDTWDLDTALVDYQTTWAIYGDSTPGGVNRITNERGTGANVDNGYLIGTVDGVSDTLIGGTTPVTGLHTQQSGLREADSQYWIDTVSQGTSFGTLPTNVHSVVLGSGVSGDRSADGIQKQIVFIASRQIGVADGFDEGFDEGFE